MRGDIVIVDFRPLNPAAKVRPSIMVQSDRHNGRMAAVSLLQIERSWILKPLLVVGIEATFDFFHVFRRGKTLWPNAAFKQRFSVRHVIADVLERDGALACHSTFVGVEDGDFGGDVLVRQG